MPSPPVDVHVAPPADCGELRPIRAGADPHCCDLPRTRAETKKACVAAGLQSASRWASLNHQGLVSCPRIAPFGNRLVWTLT